MKIKLKIRLKNHKICGKNLRDPSTSRATCTKCAKSTFCLTTPFPPVHVEHKVQNRGPRPLPYCGAGSGARIRYSRRINTFNDKHKVFT